MADNYPNISLERMGPRWLVTIEWHGRGWEGEAATLDEAMEIARAWWNELDALHATEIANNEARMAARQ